MIILGIMGKARSGKDTIAKTIIEAYGSKYNIKRYAFADALKEEIRDREMELCLRFGVKPDVDQDGRWRSLMQFWGTDFRRAQDPNYWIKRVSAKLDIENPAIAIITDVRFRNEAHWILDRGGYIVKVERHNFVDLSVDSGHSSETDLDFFTDWFAKIQCNDGEAEQLKKDAIIVFDMLVEELDLVGFALEELSTQEPVLSNERKDVVIH
jgi:hypothetical protein